MVVRRNGFTLLELLVVVGIVSLLIGLLVPALGAARDRAVRVSSQMNLRTIHQWQYLYAGDADGRVPLGYRGGRMQWNTMVYSGTSDKFVLFGRLYLAGLIERGEALYSPAETALGQSFDTVENPWPPGTPGVNVQGGYSMAPLVDWGFAALVPVMPRLSDLGFRAILADGFGLPARVDSRHGDGIHVLHADAGVRWVDRSVFDDLLEQCVGFSPENNVFQLEIWERLDRR